jgi:hypothetical protein
MPYQHERKPGLFARIEHLGYTTTKGLIFAALLVSLLTLTRQLAHLLCGGQ